MPAPVTPLVATDAIVVDSRRRVLVIKRKFPPFQGMYALPGGFVEVGETLEEACRRELGEETGVQAGAMAARIALGTTTPRPSNGQKTGVVCISRSITP